MGRHEGHDTFGAIADDYVTGRARELVRQFDQWMAMPAGIGLSDLEIQQRGEWTGAAAEILRELTRDA